MLAKNGTERRRTRARPPYHLSRRVHVASKRSNALSMRESHSVTTARDQLYTRSRTTAANRSQAAASAPAEHSASQAINWSAHKTYANFVVWKQRVPNRKLST